MSAAESSHRVPDDELIRRTADGDAEAFAALYRRRRPDIYRFSLHMTANPAVAEDVVQDVFLTVMRDADRFDAGRATVVAWLCGIARNHLRQRLARDSRLEPMERDDDPGADTVVVEPGALTDLIRVERVEALRRAVQALPVRYREAVVLCDLQELSYQEAADALACAVGTVRSRLHRARALLASKLARTPAVGAESAVRRAADRPGPARARESGVLTEECAS